MAKIKQLADYRNAQRTPSELVDYISEKLREADRVFIHYSIGNDGYWILADKDRRYSYAEIYFDLAQAKDSIKEAT